VQDGIRVVERKRVLRGSVENKVEEKGWSVGGVEQRGRSGEWIGWERRGKIKEGKWDEGKGG